MDLQINSAVSKVSLIHTLTADFLAKRLKEKGFDEFASSHGNILFQLSKAGKIKMGELAEKINRDKSTTTVLVRKLKEQGLIKEEPDESDKRNKIISLTEKGAEYNKITSQISKELIETFYKDFTDSEKEQLCLFLNKIEMNFAAAAT